MFASLRQDMRRKRDIAPWCHPEMKPKDLAFASNKNARFFADAQNGTLWRGLPAKTVCNPFQPQRHAAFLNVNLAAVPAPREFADQFDQRLGRAEILSRRAGGAHRFDRR